ncbi:choice-of-anchor B family protein [Dokdonia sinensis]|uniref:Choice-of-anchor B family protein n=1 Tax=Dokdonia sinensis TaxID=2479847 RepID=A0A3M0G118_9FLAO|nr:choice-of-anchor B family protein [Dokdonia sinensis]RMB58604.1 choice-of-anchor B family protein [Dokdonia sinensis]
MKKILQFAFILSSASFSLIAQTPCEDNLAAGFPCEGYDLQARITPAQMDASLANDSWGWTDPESGIEYALIGLNNGTAFFNLEDPTNPLYLGKLPTHTINSTWRDIKVYSNHAFIVSEASGHGMQVFDLTRLRDVSTEQTFTEDAHYDGFGKAHNIVINTDSGYAYGVGTQTFSGGPHFINIQDPLNPVGEGGYADNAYSHDAQVVTYTGPDSDYTGREILIGSNENEIAIVDITDKSNPVEISTIGYSNIGYVHQGWFTENQRYFLLGDETDELLFGFATRTIIFDFNDLDNPELHFEFEGNNTSTDHNGYVVGDKYYLASYRAGMRVFDISDIGNESMTEIGYFDTFPPNDAVGTSALWNVYPFFRSGNIVLSGDSGFTLVRDPDFLGIEDETLTADLSVYPNPATTLVNLQFNKPLGSVSIYNILGQEVLQVSSQENKLQLNTSDLPSGVYFVQVGALTQRLIIK